MRNLTEFEDIVRAIRRGGIDALLISGEDGDRVVVLEGAEDPYRVLVENLSDGAATLDSSGTIVYANRRFAEILGTPHRQIIGAPFTDTVTWTGRDELARMIREGASGGIELRTTEEPQRVIHFSVQPLKLKGSSETHVCLIAKEVTNLKKVTEALRLSESMLGELSARLLSLQDEERRRIARDLHDITGQSLAVQSMMLWNLLERDSELDADVRKLVSECASLNKRITDEVRTLSYLLHPPLIDECGLAAAVKWYAGGFSTRSGITVSVEADPDFPRLSPQGEIALFRIVQEGLTNVHRYSGSSRASVRLRRVGTEAVMEIRDFGKGMGSVSVDSTAPKPSLGVGILGMRERVRQLAGELEITSRENRGTLVTVRLPIRKAEVASDNVSTARPPETLAAKQTRKAKTAKSGR